MKFDRYVLFPWFEEHGERHIHPDDLEYVRSAHPYGRVFGYAGRDGKYSVLQFGDRTIRVLPKLLQNVPSSRFDFFDVGEDVVLVKDEQPATVLSVMWHFEKNEPIYQLRVNGKKKSKRYWQADLTR
ncbi:MAG: hypothetical protein AAGF88_03930 [Pseudomonadota bacterium]